MKRTEMNKTHSCGRRIAAVSLSLLLFLTGCSKIESSSQEESSSQLTVSDTISAQNSASYQTSSAQSEADTSSTSAAQTSKKATVTLTAVGDNLIHRQLYTEAGERAGGSGYDFTYLYAHVAEKIAAADIAQINQETVIAPDRAPSSYPCFNSPKELGEEVVRIGFDVVSLANNHSFDQGESGLRSCLNFWKTQDVVTTGAYLNAADLESVAMYEANGVKFGFVAFTDPTNGLKLPSGSELTVLLQSNFESVENKIKQAKKVCDVVVAIPHWGIEYTTQQNESQTMIAQQLADCGADLIIGSHSHCLQPIEMLTSADGREVPVVYSLGNFVSGQQERLRVVGGMVDFAVTYDFETEEVSVDAIDFYPLITHYTGTCHNVCVYLYRDYTKELAAQHGVYSITGKALTFDYIDDLVTSVIDEKYLADDWRPAA